jgi:hypothetical protein
MKLCVQRSRQSVNYDIPFLKDLNYSEQIKIANIKIIKVKNNHNVKQMKIPKREVMRSHKS